ncbi:hypothetical protein H4W31_008335 [Plantactinospora soyae]|uniref:Uncharacterized protein n=1 Tax=Plantactinospora soyae TaxID=1544732 RepID=A0A927MDN8_9ACTN|nr:hypothetical protein [Plantactinospora soyae]
MATTDVLTEEDFSDARLDGFLAEAVELANRP